MPEDTGLDFASEVDGVMHACGHDAHTAMLAGAARLLAGRRGELAGRVRFLFQPGEEGQGGAAIALRRRACSTRTDGGEPVSWAFAIHQSPTIPSGVIATRRGPLLASADELHVTVRGRGGHASMPHHANDPIPVACEIVQALQTWVTRRVDVFTPAVVTSPASGRARPPTSSPRRPASTARSAPCRPACGPTPTRRSAGSPSTWPRPTR